MIKGTDLTNRVEHPDTNRGPDQGETEQRRAPKRPDLSERLDRARTLPPSPGACRTCFMRGRDAVVELVSKSVQPLADRLEAAAAIRSKDDHIGDPSSFPRGRDAAIAAIRGDA